MITPRHTDDCQSCARPTTEAGRRLLAQFHGWPKRQEYPWNLLDADDILAIEAEARAAPLPSDTPADLVSIHVHELCPPYRHVEWVARAPLPSDTPVDGLRAVAEIVRRHTHQGLYAMTAYAGPNPEEDCLLCRALVAAGVLTLDGIGSGTRAALTQKPRP